MHMKNTCNVCAPLVIIWHVVNRQYTVYTYVAETFFYLGASTRNVKMVQSQCQISCYLDRWYASLKNIRYVKQPELLFPKLLSFFVNFLYEVVKCDDVSFESLVYLFLAHYWSYPKCATVILMWQSIGNVE